MSQSTLAQTVTDDTIAQDEKTAKTIGDWSIVEMLTDGEKLQIDLRSGKSLKGRLASVSNTGLSLSEGGKTISINRDDVSRVYQVIGRTRGKSALRGAGIGGAIGGGIGLILYLPGRDDLVGWLPASFAVLGAGIGVGVGAVFSGGQKRVLIYRAS
ncbi:MAG: hypothetical protein L0226_06920 [Acidobacteria bacterium]|nr:hypothetical protein [Acidobacteriota bacterium]